MPNSIHQIRLREIQRADLPKLFAFQLEPEGNQRAQTHPRNSTEFDEHWNKILSDPTVIVRAIVAGDSLAGSISCFQIQDEYHVGYWLGKAFWGDGVATCALNALLKEVRMRPLTARVAASNVSSIRVLEKCGFHEMGREWSPATERFIACEEAVYRLQ